MCPKCGLLQDSETALKEAENVENALNIQTSLQMLTSKYPELGTLLNQIRQKEGL